MEFFKGNCINHALLFINFYCEFKNCPLVYLYHFILAIHKYYKAYSFILSMVVSCVFKLIYDNVTSPHLFIYFQVILVPLKSLLASYKGQLH